MDVEKYYDDMANNYDQLIKDYSWHISSWIPTKTYSSNNKILDVACGSGYLGKLLLPNMRNLILDGCDLSYEMLKIADSKKCYRFLYKWDLNNQNKYATQFSSNKVLKIPSNYYDFIFCFGAFEYIQFNLLVVAIYSILDQLKKGGMFIFNTHIHPHPFIKQIIPHNLQAMLDVIQPICKIELVEPTIAYVLPEYGPIWYHIWKVLKL